MKLHHGDLCEKKWCTVFSLLKRLILTNLYQLTRTSRNMLSVLKREKKNEERKGEEMHAEELLFMLQIIPKKNKKE